MAIGRVTVGDAWVDLHADSQGLRDEINRAVGEASDGQKFTIPMGIDSRSLRDEVNRSIMEASAGQKFTLPMSVDSRGLRDEVDRAIAEASAGQKFTLPMSVDSRGLRQAVDTAISESSANKHFLIPVDIATTTLRQRLSEAVEEAARGLSFKVPITVKSEGLREKVKAIAEEASVGQSVKIKVEIEDEKIHEFVHKLTEEMKELREHSKKLGEEFKRTSEHSKGLTEKIKESSEVVKEMADNVRVPFVNPFTLITAGAAALLPALVSLTSSLALAGSSLAALAPAAIIGAGAFGILHSAIKNPVPALKDLETHWKDLIDQWSRPFQAGMIDFLGRMQQQLPVISTGMMHLSESMGYVLARLADVGTSARFGRQLADVFDQGAHAVHIMGDTLANMLRIFMGVSAAASPLMVRFADFTKQATGRLAEMVERGEDTGKLAAFFQRAGDEMANWGKAIGYVAQALFNVFHVGSEGSGNLSEKVLALSKRFDDWSKSVNGQSEIRRFMDFLRGINWGALVQMAAAVLAAQKALGMLSAALNIAKAAMAAFNLMMAGNPIGLIAIAVAALAVGFVMLYEHSKPFRDMINRDLLPVVKSLAEEFKKEVLPRLKELGEFIKSQVVPTLKDLEKWFNENKSTLKVVAAVIGVVLISSLMAAVMAIKAVVLAVRLGISGWIMWWNMTKMAVTGVAAIVKWLYHQILSIWNSIYTNTINAWNNTFKFVRDLVTNVAKWLHDTFFSIYHHIVDIWHHVYDDTTNWWNNIVKWIKDTLTSWGKWIHDKFFEVWHAIVDIWHSLVSDVQGIVDSWVHWIQDRISQWATWLHDKFFEIWHAIVDIWHHLQDDVQHIVDELVHWVQDHVSQWATWIHDKIEELWHAVVDIWHHLQDDIQHIIDEVVNWVKDHISEWATWIHDKITEIHDKWIEVWHKIGEAPGKILNKAIEFVTDRFKTLIHLLNDGINAINKLTSFVGITIPNIPDISGPGAGDSDISTDGLAGGGQVKRHFAHGGGLLSGPGSPTSDSIPAWLSTEEYVVRGQAVKDVGVDKLDFINRFGRMPTPESHERMHEGGMHGGFDRLAEGGLGHILRLAGGGSAAADAIIAVAHKSGVPFNVSSTGRPGSTSTSGKSDYHSQGLAVDMTSDPGNMVRLASYFMGFAPALLEEIHSGGGGFFVKNGKRVGASYYGAEVPLHYNHVHIAAGASAMNDVLQGKVPAGPGTPDGGGGMAGPGGGDNGVMDALLSAATEGIKSAWADVMGKLPTGTQFDDVWKNIIGKVPDGIISKVSAAAAALGGDGGGGPNSGDPGSPEVEKAAYETAKSMGANPKVLLALFEAGFVESNFRNIQKAVDHDSLGFLQQRPSAGWPDPLNVPTATRSFVSRAMAKAGGAGSAGQLAQAVQVSAFPSRYDQQEGRARAALHGLGAPGFYNGGKITGPPGVDNLFVRAMAGERIVTPEQDKAYQANAHAPGFYVGGNLTVEVAAEDMKQVKDIGDFFDRVKVAARTGAGRKPVEK
jgi:phage-related protein